MVTDPKIAANVLKWAVAEMEKRIRKLASRGRAQHRPVQQHHPRRAAPSATHETARSCRPLHYIVIIIDELADLMMVSSHEVEESITRLAQMARAVGIHLILATQRPSVDVLTGLIKANFPSRISFRVAARVDSRTILDSIGAEHLLGKGDMLFLPPGTARLTRIHGAYVTEQEIARLTSYLRKTGQARLRRHRGQDRAQPTRDGGGRRTATSCSTRRCASWCRAARPRPACCSAASASASRARAGSSTSWSATASSAPPTAPSRARSWWPPDYYETVDTWPQVTRVAPAGSRACALGRAWRSAPGARGAAPREGAPRRRRGRAGRRPSRGPTPRSTRRRSRRWPRSKASPRAAGAARRSGRRWSLRFRRWSRAIPQSGYCDDALLAVGDLYREMAERFKAPRYGDDAVTAYRTLVAEYPSSRQGEEALFAVVRDRRGRAATASAIAEAARAYLEPSPTAPRAAR